MTMLTRNHFSLANNPLLAAHAAGGRGRRLRLTVHFTLSPCSQPVQQDDEEDDSGSLDSFVNDEIIYTTPERERRAVKKR